MELPTFEWKVGEEPELTMCREWVAIRFAKAVPLELVILSPQRVCLAFVSLQAIVVPFILIRLVLKLFFDKS